MSRELPSHLPTHVVRKLSQKLPDFEAIPLVSIDREGFPHVALLSYFELIYQDPSLCFFLHSSSRSTKFLRERARCTLLFVDSDFSYYVKGSAGWIGDSDSESIFQLRIESVLEDFPSAEEGKVFVKTGIRIAGSQEQLRKRLRLREKMQLQIKGTVREGDECL